MEDENKAEVISLMIDDDEQFDLKISEISEFVVQGREKVQFRFFPTGEY